MFDWIGANWIWLLLGIGVIVFFVRRGGMGCGMAGHSHDAQDAADGQLPPSAAGGGTEPGRQAGQHGPHADAAAQRPRRHGCC